VNAEPFVLSGLCTDPTEPVMFKVHITVDNSSNQYDGERYMALNSFSSYTIICGDLWSLGYGSAGNLYLERQFSALGQFNSAGVYYDAVATTTWEIVEMHFLGNSGGTSSSAFARAEPSAFLLPLYRMLC